MPRGRTPGSASPSGASSKLRITSKHARIVLARETPRPRGLFALLGLAFNFASPSRRGPTWAIRWYLPGASPLAMLTGHLLCWPARRNMLTDKGMAIAASHYLLALLYWRMRLSMWALLAEQCRFVLHLSLALDQLTSDSTFYRLFRVQSWSGGCLLLRFQFERNYPCV
jgi:hypothetical protein